jgi:hypothetical protein
MELRKSTVSPLDPLGDASAAAAALLLRLLSGSLTACVSQGTGRCALLLLPLLPGLLLAVLALVDGLRPAALA